VRIHLDDRTAEDYRLFLAIKQLPSYRLRGNIADIPDEYAARLGLAPPTLCDASKDYQPSEFLFDYQRDISRLAIRRRKFAIFAAPGMGKTLMLLEYLRHVRRYLPAHKNALIVSPLMVVEQTLAECERFYGSSLPIQQVRAKDLKHWLANAAGRIGITNYDAIRDDLEPGRLGCLCADESSTLKSAYGKWGVKLIELGKGLEWKLALTGTPAPNDRIEYANHAVLLDAFPTVNSFLATYFVNRGETSERWELKPHALGSFYRALSHWCIFLSDPSVYGWRDNVGTIPPIEITIHDVPMGEALSARAREYTGKLFVDGAGGIVSRGKLARMAREDGSPKPEFIRQLVESWTPGESTLIWCRFNDEQKKLESLFPDAASIDGQTPEAERFILLDWFKGLICDCERDRRLACVRAKKIRRTCSDTTPRTSINSNGTQRNSTTSIDAGENNTQPVPNCKQRPVPTRKGGNNKIPKPDSPNGSESTGLPPQTTGPCSNHRAESVPSASGHNSTNAHPCFTSITVMQPESFVVSSASNVTTFSARPATNPNALNGPQHTCVCTDQQKNRGRVLISKALVLGFGLNLQVATRQVFSGIDDSYESFYQAVKRSNRVGSTKPLRVHIPVTELERPMVENVLRKARMIERDTKEQEELFSNAGSDFLFG
jgi:hypothetical protein